MKTTPTVPATITVATGHASVEVVARELLLILHERVEGFKLYSQDAIVVIARDDDVLDNFCQLVWNLLRSNFIRKRVQAFWNQFDVERKSASAASSENHEERFRLFDKFVVAVRTLEADYDMLTQIMDRLRILDKRNALNKDLHCVLQESLMAQLPVNFTHVVNAFYTVLFCVFANVYKNKDNLGDAENSVLEEVNCSGCNEDANSCKCANLVEVINQVNTSLLKMKMLDRIAGQTMTYLVQQRVIDHINDTCQGVFDRSHLRQLEMWLDTVINWLIRIFNNGQLEVDGSNQQVNNVIQSFKVKLTYFLYENYAHLIIDQFFSIIIDFPDSVPAIDDLKICMEKIEIRKYLIKNLKNSFEVRILHPGVNTMDILTGYIAAIKAIRHLDSSGVILETVTAPIKEYLRKRSDTVRRVVTGLTEEGPTDLSEELAKGEVMKENIVVGGGSDDFSNWENWMPDPFGFDANNRKRNFGNNRTADIISMVVDIYGSKELFMNEYRNLLADRLLTQLDFNSEKELRNLELLKIRFGESLLHTCEVMLKDIADSKRINAHIQSDIQYSNTKAFDISSLIISAQFWPSFNKESLELPEEIAGEFSKYKTAYEAYKGNRTLQWRHVTGRVNLVVELGERSLEFTVPPTQAVIIYHFQSKDEWTLEELSNVMKMPATILRRRISFWQSNGLLTEIRPGTFKLIEEGEAQNSQMGDMPMEQLVKDEDDMESAMASASDQREEELQVFWSYIVGMLTNLDSLPIERIHQMLKLFATHGIGVEFSQDELKDFLQRKVREHKLLFTGGVYQLPK